MTAITITVFAVFSAGKAFAIEFKTAGVFAVAILSAWIHWLEVDTLSWIGRWKINAPRVLILWECLMRHFISWVLWEIVAEISECQLWIDLVLLILIYLIWWQIIRHFSFLIPIEICLLRLLFSYLEIIPWHL